MNVGEFLTRYHIEELLVGRDADIADREVSRVEVEFGREADEGARACRVVFKLLDQASDTHRYLRRVGPPPECAIEWVAQGLGLGAAEQRACIARLLKAIDSRVAKVYTEQSILNIRPVGKSFVLMGQTRFDVLSDDGEGQLRIRLYRPDGSSEAALGANDLLDGLYSGLITRHSGS